MYRCAREEKGNQSCDFLGVTRMTACEARGKHGELGRFLGIRISELCRSNDQQFD